MNISDRLERIPLSATLSVDLKAKELASQGKDVISFCVGEPDFSTPDEAATAAHEAIEKGNTKYTNASGTKELKDAVCKKINEECGAAYTSSDIVITTGAKYACYCAVYALCNPGDEVIIPAPYWTSYRYLSELAGASVVTVSCTEDTGYKLTADLLKEYATDKTKAVIINNPNNPSGAVYTKEELNKLCTAALGLGIAVISDEIYSALCYDSDFTSVACLPQELRDNSIIINGMSKSFAMTGWRIGYIAAPSKVAKAISSMLSHTTGSPCTVSQDASLEALSACGSFTKEMAAEFKKRRDLIVLLSDKLGLKYAYPHGAFYLYIDVQELLKENESSAQFAMDLLEKEGIATVPCDDFGTPGYLRLSYTVSENRIKEAFERFGNFLKERKNG